MIRIVDFGSGTCDVHGMAEPEPQQPLEVALIDTLEAVTAEHPDQMTALVTRTVGRTVGELELRYALAAAREAARHRGAADDLLARIERRVNPAPVADAAAADIPVEPFSFKYEW